MKMKCRNDLAIVNGILGGKWFSNIYSHAHAHFFLASCAGVASSAGTTVAVDVVSACSPV